MKVYPKKSDMGWYPTIVTHDEIITLDCSFPKFLDIDYEEYERLLLSNSSFNTEAGYFFSTRYKCKKFIDKVILPRLIMANF